MRELDDKTNRRDDPTHEVKDDRSRVKSDALFDAHLLLMKRLPPPQLPPDGFYVRDHSQEQAASLALQQKYGIRPRSYAGLLAAPENDAERTFLAVLPEVTAFVNARLPKDLQLTPAEITVNFMAEGGVLALREDASSGLSGFDIGGVDTLVDNPMYEMYLHPSVQKRLRNGHRERIKNEQGKTVTDITDFELSELVYANAALFAASKKTVARQMHGLGIDMGLLDVRAQFFWTTVCYNAGPGASASLLKEHGVDWYKSKWTKGDNFAAFSRIPQFNALMRTASFEFLLGGADPKTERLELAKPLTRKISIEEAIAAYTAQRSVLLPAARLGNGSGYSLSDFLDLATGLHRVGGAGLDMGVLEDDLRVAIQLAHPGKAVTHVVDQRQLRPFLDALYAKESYKFNPVFWSNRKAALDEAYRLIALPNAPPALAAAMQLVVDLQMFTWPEAQPYLPAPLAETRPG